MKENALRVRVRVRVRIKVVVMLRFRVWVTGNLPSKIFTPLHIGQTSYETEIKVVR